MGDPQEDIDFDLIANEAPSEPLNHLEINRETLKRGFWLLNQPAEIISQQSGLLSDNEALAIEVVFLESGDIGYNLKLKKKWTWRSLAQYGSMAVLGLGLFTW